MFVMQIAILWPLATALISGVVALWLFDRLLRLEHERYPAEWARDGMPIGWLWRPAAARPIRGFFARTLASATWLFRTPAWVGRDEDANRLLRDYRAVHILGLAASAVMLLAIGLATHLAA